MRRFPILQRTATQTKEGIHTDTLLFCRLIKTTYLCNGSEDQNVQMQPYPVPHDDRGELC